MPSFADVTRIIAKYSIARLPSTILALPSLARNRSGFPPTVSLLLLGFLCAESIYPLLIG